MHPRAGLHQVAFLSESTATFIAHCRAIGVSNMTLVTPLLVKPGETEAARQALAAGGPRVESVNHVFAVHPDLERDMGDAAAGLGQAIEIAALLNARSIYLISGGRGALDWEQAAERFAALIAPCKVAARERGIALLVENANVFTVDIHMAHT